MYIVGCGLGGNSFHDNYKLVCANKKSTMGEQEPGDASSERLQDIETPLSTLSPKSKTKGGFWWHVNKSGFPITEETWSKMWQHIIDIHPDGSQISTSIRGQCLKRVPIPPSPSVNPAHPVHHNLLAVQNYMNVLQYNHTGTQFFDIKKYRPLSRQVNSMGVYD